MAPHDTTKSNDFTLDDVMLSICSIDNKLARYDVLISTVSTLVDKLDGILQKINELESSFIELKRENVSLNDTVNTLSQKIKLLEGKLNTPVSPNLTALNDIKRHSQHTDTQQNTNNSRKFEIVISGFPESNNLNEPMQIVDAVFKALDADVTPAEILNARFMRKKSNDSLHNNAAALSLISPVRDRVSIAVGCSNHSVVNKIIMSKKKHGLLDFSMLDKRLLSHEIVNFLSQREFRINVNQLLPAETFKLLGMTKKILKSVGTKYVWSSNGIVRAKINDHSMIYNVSSSEDIKKLKSYALVYLNT